MGEGAAINANSDDSQRLNLDIFHRLSSAPGKTNYGQKKTNTIVCRVCNEYFIFDSVSRTSLCVPNTGVTR